jgi:hypothetical protein
MAAPSDVRKYLYWSERRIAKIGEDNGLILSRSGSVRYKSPAGPWVPQVELDTPRRSTSRPGVADKVERHLGGVTVTDFVTPPPVRFAKGCGTITFGEFVNFGKKENIVSIFTEVVSSRSDRVGVCMFGSRENLAEMIASSPTTDTGWSSSAAPEVLEFIKSRGARIHPIYDSHTLAREAVNLVCHQGGAFDESCHRGFTYGHVSDVGEWMLEVYLDVEFREDRTDSGCAYDRVIIGAPLWIRTPSARALTLYANYSPDELRRMTPILPGASRAEQDGRQSLWKRWRGRPHL